MAKMGRPKSDDPMNYRFTIRFSNAEQKQLEAYAEKYDLTKGRCLRKDWNYYTDRISTAKMLLTISEVRGWQNQEKTAGGMCCEPVRVRAKERKIIRDKEDGLNPQLADRMTLNELYDRFIEQKYDLKPSTKVNYLYMYNHFVRPTFGKRLIGKIKYSDVKKFYYRIILDKEMKANTLDSIHTQLHPAFQMAVRDGLLRQNPTDGLMAEIKKSHIWEDNPRHALTIPQQKAYMDYLKAHREYQGWVPIYFYTKDDFRTKNHSDDR